MKRKIKAQHNSIFFIEWHMPSSYVGDKLKPIASLLRLFDCAVPILSIHPFLQRRVILTFNSTPLYGSVKGCCKMWKLKYATRDWCIGGDAKFKDTISSFLNQFCCWNFLHASLRTFKAASQWRICVASGQCALHILHQVLVRRGRSQGWWQKNPSSVNEGNTFSSRR